MITYLVDGYNLLFSYVEYFDDDKEMLIEELARHARLYNFKVHIIFDAHQTDAPWGSIKNVGSLSISFTRGNQTADDFIVEYLKTNTLNAIVVSKDQALLRECVALGAQTQTPKSFLRRITKNHKRKEKPLSSSRYEVEHYLGAFLGRDKKDAAKKDEKPSNPDLLRLWKIFRQGFSEEQ